MCLVLTLIHGMAGAAWFGAMVYSLTILQPRAVLFFPRTEDFEQFITTLSQGARWKVLGAFAIMAVSGIGLVFLKWPDHFHPLWLGLLGGKIFLFLVSLGVFYHVSWHLWPARVLALPEEMPVFQRKFRAVGRLMISLVGLNMMLGILAHGL